MTAVLLCLCREQAGRPKCPVDPFFIVPDKCKCVDFQVRAVTRVEHTWCVPLAAASCSYRC